MERWNLKQIAFEPGVERSIRDFIRQYPAYKKMLDARMNDLLNFPDLVWASAVMDQDDSGLAEFVTYHQQIDLAGKVYRKNALIYITHFEFHR